MATAFIVSEDGVITNVIEAPPEGTEFPGMVRTPEGVVPVIGGAWDGVNLIPPPPIKDVPKTVSKRQLKLALLDLGLLDDVEELISSSPDRALRINWEDGSVFDRDHSLVSTVASVLGKTTEEIDGLFILAGTK